MIKGKEMNRVNTTNLMTWKASGILLRTGQGMTWALFMTSLEAVLNDVILSTTLLSPTIENILDFARTLAGKLFGPCKN